MCNIQNSKQHSWPSICGQTTLPPEPRQPPKTCTWKRTLIHDHGEEKRATTITLLRVIQIKSSLTKSKMQLLILNLWPRYEVIRQNSEGHLCSLKNNKANIDSCSLSTQIIPCELWENTHWAALSPRIPHCVSVISYCQILSYIWR